MCIKAKDKNLPGADGLAIQRCVIMTDHPLFSKKGKKCWRCMKLHAKTVVYSNRLAGSFGSIETSSKRALHVLRQGKNFSRVPTRLKVLCHFKTLARIALCPLKTSKKYWKCMLIQWFIIIDSLQVSVALKRLRQEIFTCVMAKGKNLPCADLSYYAV